jgi:hypothetical protein
LAPAWRANKGEENLPLLFGFVEVFSTPSKTIFTAKDAEDAKENGKELRYERIPIRCQHPSDQSIDSNSMLLCDLGVLCGENLGVAEC